MWRRVEVNESALLWYGHCPAFGGEGCASLVDTIEPISLSRGKTLHYAAALVNQCAEALFIKGGGQVFYFASLGSNAWQ